MEIERNLTLRFATQKDISLIIQFIHELAQYEKLENQVVVQPGQLDHWLFKQPHAEVMIGEIQGSPIGFCLFFTHFSTFLGKPGLYLEDFFIRPKYRHQGIGKVWIKELVHFALQRGYGRFELACLDWNEPSIAFYHSLGAKPLSDWTTYRLDEPAMTQLIK